VGGRIVGIVVNRLNKRGSSYYYYYYHHNYGYQYNYQYQYLARQNTGSETGNGESPQTPPLDLQDTGTKDSTSTLR